MASTDPGLSPSAPASPAPTSAWPAPAEPVARGQRRGLERRVIARVRDHIDRLAQGERVKRLHLIARRGGLYAGQSTTAAVRSAGSVAVSW